MQIYLDKLVEAVLIYFKLNPNETETQIRLRSELTDDSERVLREMLAPNKLVLNFPETAFFGGAVLVHKRDLIRVRRHGG